MLVRMSFTTYPQTNFEHLFNVQLSLTLAEKFRFMFDPAVITTTHQYYTKPY